MTIHEFERADDLQWMSLYHPKCKLRLGSVGSEDYINDFLQKVKIKIIWKKNEKESARESEDLNSRNWSSLIVSEFKRIQVQRSRV